MCNHIYSTKAARLPFGTGPGCPYPEFFSRAREAAADLPAAGSVFALPVDDSGACIFHSKEVAWKRGNDFVGKFLQLVQLLTADKTAKGYNFADFVFVGGGGQPAVGAEKTSLHITNTTFPKQAFFIGSQFLAPVTFEGVHFAGGADFCEATFATDLMCNKSQFCGLNFAAVKLRKRAFFTAVEFTSYVLFDGTQCTGTEPNAVVKFEDTRFAGITDFTDTVFTLGEQSSVNFLRTRFEDVVDFTNTQFHCQVVFSDVCFADRTEFIDTSFGLVKSSARHRGNAVEFNRIEVTAAAVLSFRSSDPQKKMFEHDVAMSFKEDPAGLLRFENVNFSKIGTASRERLNRLALSGRVEVGAGCIKYRFQSKVRAISVSDGNASLIIELCQTFTNYFTVSNGLNLGFEIVERTRSQVSFFYFTDEDLSEETFLSRLAQTEQSLWNLLAIRSDQHFLASAAMASPAPLAVKRNALVDAVDGISALLGTFFRVGVRIACGSWKEADTKSLLGAIRFNDEGAELRAHSLHKVIVDNYTGRTLLDINLRQNQLLPPMDVEILEMSTNSVVPILFLGANSMSSPLDLEREFSKIKTCIKLSKESNNLDLRHEWAVTVDSLRQALLDESPQIVHFSGHGAVEGIVLRNELGAPKVVSADALSSLFKLFKDTVRCVVLNSCYSEHQARAIRLHIQHVIGMSSAIADSAALAFTTGFYQALGSGRDIPFSFDLGITAIQMEGCPGENVPILL